ncbi:uncharacterized protein LOC130671119 [Microplitis mediator]|uniref:uncharacterized protein LOC130671119 n=1 Tax=Microplitis mediator TaxID=375433 RepID=UPI0025542952|nr:uncharacterized protein LOC130671119 [Microplitis mediator]
MKTKLFNTFKFRAMSVSRAKVDILQESGEYRGLYFSTEDMRQDMVQYPEIVFIDGTYNLFKRCLTLKLIVVENAHGETKIAGVGMLENEQRETIKWFINCFKNSNIDAISRIRSFITDKDLTGRNVIAEVIPNVPMYLCMYHTLRTFGRQVLTQSMSFSTENRDSSLKLLDNLVKSKTEKDYNSSYQELYRTAAPQVIEYFNKNWHPIRKEWSLFSMVNGNLGNTTNNRLKSLNGKIKDCIQRHCTMVDFTKAFFQFIHHRQYESDHKRANEFMKKSVVPLSSTEDEIKYEKLLSGYAFSQVKKELISSSLVSLVLKDEKEKKHFSSYNEDNIIVTLSECQCVFWTSMMLPCKHIFAVRKINNISLFDSELCANRWFTDNNFMRQTLSIKSIEKSVTSQSFCSISIVISPKKLSAQQKESRLKPLLNEIFHTVINSSQETFEYSMNTLRELQHHLRQNKQLAINNNDINEPVSKLVSTSLNKA